MVIIKKLDWSTTIHCHGTESDVTIEKYTRNETPATCCVVHERGLQENFDLTVRANDGDNDCRPDAYTSVSRTRLDLRARSAHGRRAGRVPPRGAWRVRPAVRHRRRWPIGDGHRRRNTGFPFNLPAPSVVHCHRQQRRRPATRSPPRRPRTNIIPAPPRGARQLSAP